MNCPAQPQPQLPFTAESQISWARSIGAHVAKRFGHAPGSQERADLIQVAIEHVLEIYSRPAEGKWNEDLGRMVYGFDPSQLPPGGDAEGLFRGWLRRGVSTECIRAAKRLRNGGTYRTCRPEYEPAAVAVLGDDAERLADDSDSVVADDGLASGLGAETMDDCSQAPYGRRLARSLTARS